jgi:hypothetical protein
LGNEGKDMQKVFFASTLISVILIALPSSSSAQGVLIDNGIGLSGGFSSHDDATTIVGSVGYVANGILEFGLSIATTNDDVLEVNALGVGPFVAGYPLRQGDGMPLTVRIGAAYEFDSFGGESVDALEDLGIDLSGSAYAVGVGIAHELTASPTVAVIPEAGIAYVHASLKAKAFGESETETDDSTPVFFSVSLVFGPRTATRFFVVPQLTVSDGETAFGIGAGVALGR